MDNDSKETVSTNRIKATKTRQNVVTENHQRHPPQNIFTCFTIILIRLQVECLDLGRRTKGLFTHIQEPVLRLAHNFGSFIVDYRLL